MEHLYWVGIKESEIRSCGNFFCGSITYNGSGKNGNISYTKTNKEILNYNEDSDLLDNFMRESLLKIIKKDPQAKFMFYNAFFAFWLGDDILKHTICLNEKYILNILRDKMRMRFWMANSVPVLKTVVVAGNDCTYEYFQSVFPGCTHFVLQGCTGAGGNDTYIVDEFSGERIFSMINMHEIYLLSPYLFYSYSVNTHVLVGENIIHTPSSMQIIEQEDDRLVYHGADFIEYGQIPLETQKKIIKYTNVIATHIKNLGYRGILGIDYIVQGNDVFFLEINPRFQSSTALINIACKTANQPTLQEQVWNIFEGVTNMDFDSDFKVPYSSYIIDQYDDYDFFDEYIKAANASDEIKETLYDGYESGIDCENHASLFSIVLSTNIVTINPNGRLNIHENIRPYRREIPHVTNEAQLLALKSKLFVQGVQICHNAQSYFQMHGMRKGTYSSIDIYLTDKIVINCPTELKLHSMSPFTIDLQNNRLGLFYANKLISDIQIDTDEEYAKQRTTSGMKYGDLSFLATDRLRLHHSLGCYYQNSNQGCSFCDVPPLVDRYHMEDIFEVTDWHLEHSKFQHILIGGGSRDSQIEYERILEIIKYLRKRTNKNIYLMSVPPVKTEILEQYKAAGLNEIAFNIEIYDREIASGFMAGKGTISLETYKNALVRAVELWGNTGNVKSLLVYGLEKDETFLQGVQWMAAHGIQPVISVFRPLRNSQLAQRIPPESEAVTRLFFNALRITQKYNLIPGPDCIYCQNNTLSIPIYNALFSDN